MSATSRGAACERSWEVSAARDGRLLQKDLDSLRRHMASCVVCSAEERRLEALGAALRSMPPFPDDTLAARRLRNRLLSEVNEWMVGQAPKRRSALGRAWLGALAAAALVLVSVGFRLAHVGGSRAVVPAVVKSVSSPYLVPVEVTAEPGSRWRKEQREDGVDISLDDGEILAHIGPRRPGQFVRIQLPDGSIEDLGTVLSVRVNAGRTTSVRVLEGRVVLRLEQRAPIELGAGQAWSLPPVAALPASTTAPHQAVPRAHTPAAIASRALRASRVASGGEGTLGTAPQATEASTRAAAGKAAASTREEDEAYLHIVALARAHQLDEARAAAKDYLLRFPNGFRREEVLGVATH